ncbi:MAG: DNA polymerase I [Reyranellaceae bacterium]
MSAKATKTAAKTASKPDNPAGKPETKPGPKLGNLRNLYLVDGSGYIFRAFHALPPMTRADGTPVNAVFGFATMLMKLMEDAATDHLAVIFDAGRETFRNQIYDQYKAHRPEPPEELVPQFALIREAVRAFNVPCIELPGYEADDLIATYADQARALGANVIIVSSDKDLMQLVREGVQMLDPIKNRPIGEAEVLEKFGVPPEKVVDVQALAGDSTDNVPGVPGIGIKTAAQLITEYGDLETLLASTARIKQPKRREALEANAELARISKKLVQLDHNVPVPQHADTLDKTDPDPTVLIPWLEFQGFKRILPRARERFGDAPPGTPAPDLSDGIETETQRQARVAAVNAEKAQNGDAAPASPAAKTQYYEEIKDELPPIGQTPYELVADALTLESWMAEAMRVGMVTVDTETDSLDELKANLIGVSLALPDGRACYIPIGHRKPGEAGTFDFDGAGAGALLPNQLPLEKVVAVLKPVLESDAVLKIGQNVKYDLKVLRRHGIDMAPVDDTMLLSFVLEGGKHGHGMDELSELFLGHKPITYDQVTGTGRNRVTFDQVPLEKALPYSAEDAEVTYRLWRLFKPRLVGESMATMYERYERPLIQVLADMEQAGIKVDEAELKRLSADFAERLVELEKQIHALVGHPFNIGSPKQLGEVLFDELKLPGGQKSSKTGAYTTSADVLEELSTQHELPRRVLDWRQLAKLKSTYTDALLQQIDANDRRVHTSYQMTGAATGRLASTDPNLQNIPVRTEEGRKIRKAFVAEPGHTLLSADYSQIELRLLAHVADIETLKQAFRDGQDIHAITASQVFGIPVKGMDPMVRRRAKAINFGIIYGISAFGLAAQLGIPQKEAGDYIRTYFERYPGIRDYMERTKSYCRANGFVQTPFGRKVFLNGINDKNPARRSFSERAAINAPLQGGAADIIKKAMIRLPPALAQAGLKTRMLLQVHDELLFEVPQTELKPAADAIKQVMESVATLSIPLVVETGHGQSWAEAH